MKKIASTILALVCLFSMVGASASPLTYDDLLADAGDTPVAIASEEYVSMYVDGDYRMFEDVQTGPSLMSLIYKTAYMGVYVSASLNIPNYDLNGEDFDEMEGIALTIPVFPIAVLPQYLCIGVNQPESLGSVPNNGFYLRVLYEDYSRRYNQEIYNNHSATAFSATTVDYNSLNTTPDGSSFMIIIDQVSSDGYTFSGRFAGRLVYEYDFDKSVRITNGKFSVHSGTKLN